VKDISGDEWKCGILFMPANNRRQIREPRQTRTAQCLPEANGNPTTGMHSLRVKVPDYPDARIHFRESYFSGALDSIPPEAQ